MKELAEKLAQFKQITIEIIKVLQQDEVDKLDSLLDGRQMVIEKMEGLQYTTEEFTNVCNELDILNVERELSELLQAKRESAKQELNKIQLTKNATINYNKSFYANMNIFNKQI